MSAVLESPLRGKPATRETLDAKGRLQYKIRPRFLTPWRAKIKDKVREISLLGFIWMVGSNLWVAGYSFHLLCVLLAHCVLIWIVVEFFLDFVLPRSETIGMSVDAVTVPGALGRRSYNRNVPHQFLLLTHDQTQIEYAKNDLVVRKASAKGKVRQPKVYYGESFHVVMSYAGHRVDLVTVYGLKEAVAILARLQYCDHRLNEVAGIGGGVNQRPEQDWPETPGGFGDVT